MILPDLAAGCSMADMAAIAQVEDCWDAADRRPASRTSTVPVTYMNSSAAIKAFTGRHGGTICTSSNAQHRARLGVRAGRRRDGTARCCSCPTSTSAATPPCASSASRSTTASSATRTSPDGGLTAEQLRDGTDDPVARALLGARPVLRRGRRGRRAARSPASRCIVHPECQLRGRRAGRRGRLDREDHPDHRRPRRPARPGSSAPSSTSCGGSREQFPEQQIAFLEKNVCYCSTMNRIDLPHLVWALESLVEGRVVNPIRVDPRWPLRRGCARPDARAARHDPQGLTVDDTPARRLSRAAARPRRARKTASATQTFSNSPRCSDSLAPWARVSGSSTPVTMIDGVREARREVGDERDRATDAHVDRLGAPRVGERRARLVVDGAVGVGGEAGAVLLELDGDAARPTGRGPRGASRTRLERHQRVLGRCEADRDLGGGLGGQGVRRLVDRRRVDADRRDRGLVPEPRRGSSRSR